MNFSAKEKESLNRLTAKITKAELSRISSMDDLWSLTDEISEPVIKKIIQLDPTRFGFKGKKIPNESVHKNIVKVDVSQCVQDDANSTRTYQYLPAPVFKAFMRMNQQFIKDNPGRTLLVGSGYRSCAYQATILIGLLVNTYNFDISKTLKGVAIPGYSQHGSATETAIDISNIDGQPSIADPEDFKNSIEYQWLTKNANKHGFYESYPPNNLDGIKYEPWHWQYRLSSDRFMSDISTKRNEKAYDTHALDWHAAMDTNFGHIYLEKPAMVSQLPKTSLGKTVLCIGVGSGEELEELLKRGPKKIVAIDMSKNLLAIAKSHFPTVELLKMDMMDLKFPDSCFDFVYSSLAFHYSKDWDALLAGIYRVLKRNGFLLFSTHNPDYWGTKPFTGKPYINSRGIKVTEHRATLSGGVDVTYYNIGSKVMIDEALTYGGFTLNKTFEPIIQNADSKQFNEIDAGDYEFLKAKNAESPLFYVVSAVKKKN